jgi:hypothetical protein
MVLKTSLLCVCSAINKLRELLVISWSSQRGSIAVPPQVYIVDAMDVWYVVCGVLRAPILANLDVTVVKRWQTRNASLSARAYNTGRTSARVMILGDTSRPELERAEGAENRLLASNAAQPC